MTKRSNLVRTIIFLLIVIIIWWGLQFILSIKWDTKMEKLPARYEEIAKEPPGTIDVVFLGSSPTYEDYIPAVIYDRQGITSINMGTSNNRAITEYYGLQYFLKYQTPKVVVLDFVELKEIPYEDYSAREFVENIPDPGIKYSTIKALYDTTHDLIVKADIPSLVLPMLYYHSRWDDLEMVDFKLDTDDRIYGSYLKGCFITKHTELSGLPKNVIMQKSVEIPDVQYEYYDRIVSLCRDKGIDLVISLPPRFDMHQDEYDAVMEYADENDIPVWDNMQYETLEKIGIKNDKLFFDSAHLNTEGAIPYSEYIADKLAEKYDLEDHRGKAGFEEWDGLYQQFMQAYNEMPVQE